MKAGRWIGLGLMAFASSSLFVLPVLLAPRSALAQIVTAKRLILKDGTFQAITKYEVHGDRVRYFSAERDAWEEIPNALIDWPATSKWNQDHAHGGAAEAVSPTPLAGPQAQTTPPAAVNPADTGLSDAAKIDAEAAAIRADQRARTLLVAPGLHLPDRDGIFVLDNFQSIPELVRLDQTSGILHHDAPHDVLRAAVESFHGAQEPVRINGQSAKVRVHVDDPVLYVSLDTQGEEIEQESAMVVNTHGASSVIDKNEHSSPDSHYAIVRLDVQPGLRVIGALRLQRMGAARQAEDVIPATAEILPGKHWMKLTPKEPLEIGEYALMEILGPGQINLDVWDFGVSPNAPENPHALTPIEGRD
ncbi:MAG TPA: hypothetical protein VHX60_16170 [Acidobacteriaceae bacterium]|nr:hypothetical protein [Acidobacteriaceae bacterium]